MKLVKILLLEDDWDDVAIIKRILNRSPYAPVEIRHTDTREGFCTLLEIFEPDIVLADYRLPQFSGMEALHVSLEYDPALPFIFVTGTIGEESAAASVLSGAWGLVLKSNLDKLNETIHECLVKANGNTVPEHINLMITTSQKIKRQITANREILARVQANQKRAS